MVTMEEALQRIEEWREGSSSAGKGVGVEELSLVLAAVLSTIDFDSLKRTGYTPLCALGAMDKSVMEEKGAQMGGSVKLLKECGLDIDTGRGGEGCEDGWDGKTSLIQAALKGHFALVEGLVEEGANVNKGDCNGLVPLAAAAGGFDPLSWGVAWCGSHPEIVSYLMRHGARVEGSYALHNAAHAGCPESVRVLLQAGADVNERDSGGSGLTPAQYCCCFGVDKSNASERVEALSLLLEAGADLNVKDVRAWTLLHNVASAGHSELIDVLVRRGLPVDVKSSDERTPLHFAALCGNSSSVKALIRLGASLDAVDSKNNTPLHTATLKGLVDITAELIDAGANVNAKRDGNIAPLHLASVWGSMELTYLLLEAGAEVDALTNTGSSPLMVCMCPRKANKVSARLGYPAWPGSKADRVKVAALLLEMGAAVTKSVMALVGESDCGDVVAASLSEERGARDASDRVCNTLAQHFSGSAYSEAAKEGRVVQVRLVDRTTGKSKDVQYTLSIPLMELLMNKIEQSGRRGEGGSPNRLDRHDTAAGSLPTMLDPAGRGFMGIKGKGKDEVEMTFDGVDFTEEGFAAVVQFVTTGSVKSLLTRGRRRLLSTENTDGIIGSSSETVGGGGGEVDGGSSGEASGERKRERVKLFDEVRAEQALQAADFFCIEAMSREVKALMTLYGFELAKETEEKDEPPIK